MLDRVAHATQIVIGHIGTAAFFRLGKFGAHLDLCIIVDMDDTLGRGRNHGEPDFRQRKGGRGEHLAQLRRHVVGGDALLAMRGDDIARDHWATHEAALQCL